MIFKNPEGHFLEDTCLADAAPSAGPIELQETSCNVGMDSKYRLETSDVFLSMKVLQGLIC